MDGTSSSRAYAYAAASAVAEASNQANPAWKVAAAEGGGLISVTFPNYYTTPDGVTVSVPTGQAVQTACIVPLGFFFGGILGAPEGYPVGRAVATRTLAESLTYAFAPWAVTETTIWNPMGFLRAGDPVTLRVANPRSEFNLYGPGVLICTAYKNDRSVADYCDRLKGILPPVSETGNMTQATVDALAYRLGQDTMFPPNLDSVAFKMWKATYLQFGMYLDTPRIVLLPIVRDPRTDLHSRTALQATGFAAFFIEHCAAKKSDPTKTQPDICEVSGRFITAATNGVAVRWGLGAFPSFDYNLVSYVRLVR